MQAGLEVSGRPGLARAGRATEVSGRPGLARAGRATAASEAELRLSGNKSY